MNLEHRVELLQRLREFIVSDNEHWQLVKEKAHYENPWFIPEFIEYQLQHISQEYLQANKLQEWIATYNIPSENASPKNVGLVMAGNIPLAGFHDFLSVFITGHRATIKPSSKDLQLITGIVQQLKTWAPELEKTISIADRLKGCDAYIATGSNNSSRYFDYYFAKYPHIIRRNRTSVAILTGNETLKDLQALADDVYIYFGLGCRNVTKLYLPEHFDFLPLLESFKKYNALFDVHKYKNNYDYQLAIMIINKLYYMTNGSLLLVENKSLFSPVSQLNYEYYRKLEDVESALAGNTDVQCIVGRGHLPFGTAQKPALADYADKADTLQFLLTL
jgi:hypothetical protein